MCIIVAIIHPQISPRVLYFSAFNLLLLTANRMKKTTYVTEENGHLLICSRDDQNDDIQVEYYSSQSNNVVQVRA